MRFLVLLFMFGCVKPTYNSQLTIIKDSGYWTSDCETDSWKSVIECSEIVGKKFNIYKTERLPCYYDGVFYSYIVSDKYVFIYMKKYSGYLPEPKPMKFKIVIDALGNGAKLTKGDG